MPDPSTSDSRQSASVGADHRILIENCNSIARAEIALRTGALNIKYGPNGLGKSTIARALTLQNSEEESLDQLIPFKFRAKKDDPRPSVQGAEGFNSVITFNDSYVSQFAFQRDEVLKDSFEIFINTPEYREGNQQIEALFESLKHTFIDEEEFNTAIDGFGELKEAFNLTKGGAVAKSSKGYKALGAAPKLNNIPKPLQGYRSFIESEDPAGWVTWQSKGKVYLELSENCPFCSTSNLDKATASLVSAEYESAAVRNMSALRSVIARLGRYLAPSHLEQLREITASLTELKDEQAQFLVNLHGDIDVFLRKLNALRALSFHALRDATDVGEVLRGLTIDLGSMPSLRSEATTLVVELINEKLDTVAESMGDIRRQIGQQKSRVAALIRGNQNSINGFLDSAGYRYRVRIQSHDTSYRMLLEHEDAAGHIESVAEHLSYGEKNAFALILFMHHARWTQPDLVVLDDPVSSFDKTKKFAILHQLFRGKNSLRGMTSLLLTHDIEPAIDIVRTGTSGKFVAARPVVHFLNGRAGTVTETAVESSDIATFTQVCEENVREASDPIIKCIYLRRRYEMHGVRGLEYNLLSSLLHLRSTPTIKTSSGEDQDMDEGQIAEATSAILAEFPDFDYAQLLSDLRAPGGIQQRFEATDVGYEKLQLFRTLSELHESLLEGDDVFGKFIKETYHIENEYVMQLNPRKYDAVPEYVLEACRARIQKL